MSSKQGEVRLIKVTPLPELMGCNVNLGANTPNQTNVQWLCIFLIWIILKLSIISDSLFGG